MVGVGSTLSLDGEVMDPNKGRRKHPELFHSALAIHKRNNSRRKNITTSNHNGSSQLCSPWRLACIYINTHTQHRLARLWLYHSRQSGRPRQQRHTLQENTFARHQHALIHLSIYILHCRSSLSQRHHPRSHHTYKPTPSHPRHPRLGIHRHTSPARTFFRHHPPTRHPRH